MRFLLVGALSLFLACMTTTGGGGGSSPPPRRPVPQNPQPDPVADPVTDPTPAGKGADGAKCSAAADCDSGICEGEGCGELAGTCAPKARGCTRDLREYCGCDGQTFRSSGSCPGKRFSKRGAC